jgi:hypothetical protein
MADHFLLLIHIISLPYKRMIGHLTTSQQLPSLLLNPVELQRQPAHPQPR